MSHRPEQSIPDAPASERGQSLTLDLPRESLRSFVLRREGTRDEAGAGYELSPGVLRVRLCGPDPSSDAGSIVLGTGLRLNATTVWFEPLPGTQVPYGRPSRVTLETAEGTFGPFDTMLGIESLRDDVHAVARLGNVPLAEGRRLVAFMLIAETRGQAAPVRPMAAVQTFITDPVRIRVVVESLANRMAEAVLTCGGASANARLSSFDEGRGSLFWVLSNPAETALFTGEVSAEVAGYNCVYQMRLPSVTRAAYGVLTKVPERVDYSRYRRYRRAAITGAVTARFIHPLWREVPRFERPLLDVSFGGIAFTTDPLNDALYVGLRVEPIEIRTPDGKTTRLRGTVRSLLPAPDGTMTCGMSVEPYDADSSETWPELVMGALNQTTAPGDDHVDKLWELYKESGYFHLSGKDPEEFEALSQSFRSLVDRTKSRPWLAYNSVWPSDHRIEASVSTLKLYRSTWMLHQLAKRKATQGDPRARHILRDIYLRAFEYMQTDPRCEWVISYAEAHVRWVQGSHIAFADHFQATGAATASPFRLMEVSCANVVTPEEHPKYKFGAATAEEQESILRALHAILPEPYIEAVDLVPERFDLASVTRAWGEIGLRRARAIWVARDRSGPVAAAILEMGETGTNLYRLTDSLRLVSLVHGGEDAFLGLIERSKAWFLAHGKDSFVYFWEHPDEAHVKIAKLRDLGEGRLWVIRSDLIPDFLELVCELTSQNDSIETSRPDSAVPGSMRGDRLLSHLIPMSPSPESTRFRG